MMRRPRKLLLACAVVVLVLMLNVPIISAQDDEPIPAEDTPPPPPPSEEEPLPENPIDTEDTPPPSPPPPPPPTKPRTPPAPIVITGPFGYYKNMPYSWTEFNADKWTNITAWMSGLRPTLRDMASFQWGYENGSVGPIQGATSNPYPWLPYVPSTLDLTRNGTGQDYITTMAITIRDVSFNVMGVTLASGDEFTWGTRDNDVVPQIITSPCPQGAYALISVSGIDAQRRTPMGLIGTSWKLYNATLFDSVKPSTHPWICRPWIGFTRNSSTKGVPECPTFDNGATCLKQGCQIQQRDGLCTFTDIPGAKLTTKLCVPRNDTITKNTDYDDPTDYCPRAAAAIGLDVDVPTPFFAAFAIIDNCTEGPIMSTKVLNEILYTHPNGISRFINDSSFGRAVFDKNTSVIKTIKIPCGVSITPGVNGINDIAEYIGKQKLFPEAEGYSRMVYIGPDNCKNGCPESGLADGRRVYILAGKGDTADSLLFLFKHELGHSMGLFHASQNGRTMGDRSTPMGGCLTPDGGRCLFAAPHLVQQLGWRNPIAILNAMTLPLGATYNYTVPALVDEFKSVIAIQIDWAAKPSNIFVSLRVAKGQDEDVSDAYANKISVHTANWLGSEWNYPDYMYIPVGDVPTGKHDLSKVLDEDKAFIQAGLIIKHVSFDNTTDTSIVRVCRRAVDIDTVPDDC